MPRIFMPIAAAFAPNYTLRDVIIAVERSMPWNAARLLEGDSVQAFEESFRAYMGVEQAVSFDSGRSGFFAILKALDLKRDDEVILQAFTTVALPNTIKLFGLKPVFVDIDRDSYNMDPDRLEEAITDKTRLIVIQHTFGNPADMDRIMEIAKKHSLLTVEDCAHALGAEYQGEKTGTFADAAFFSFGRDKVISAVMGGMVIARDAEMMNRIQAVRRSLALPTEKSVRRSLNHPIITFIALHTYDLFGLGRLLMFLAYRLDLMDKAYTKQEKRGEPDEGFAKRLPDALAALGLNQMRLLDRFNHQRQNVAECYARNLDSGRVGLPQTKACAKNVFLWYTITVPKKKKLIRKADKRGIVLGDWFPRVIGPIEADPGKAGYTEGSCPVAEEVSAHCVNLPTHHNIHRKEAEKVIDFINKNA